MPSFLTFLFFLISSTAITFPLLSSLLFSDGEIKFVFVLHRKLQTLIKDVFIFHHKLLTLIRIRQFGSTMLDPDLQYQIYYGRFRLTVLNFFVCSLRNFSFFKREGGSTRKSGFTGKKGVPL